MRVLLFIGRFFLAVIGVGVFVYILGAKMWLLAGGYFFSKDAKSLFTYATDSAEYIKQCQLAPASSSTSNPLAFQLRFIDDRSYVIELVCSLIEDSPIEIKSGRLLPLVHKLPGSSGLSYVIGDANTNEVALGVLHEKTLYTLNLDSVVNRFGASVGSLQTQIKNTCSGFGYFCCDVDSQQGVGENQPIGITDCPNSCYATCTHIPYFSAFVSDPFPSDDRTIVMDSSSLSMTFSYTLDLADSPVASVTIEYGDGSTDTSTQTVGVFTHTYTCTGPCKNEVKISATDTDGKTTAQNANTRYTIVKQ